MEALTQRLTSADVRRCGATKQLGTGEHGSWVPGEIAAQHLAPETLGLGTQGRIKDAAGSTVEGGAWLRVFPIPPKPRQAVLPVSVVTIVTNLRTVLVLDPRIKTGGPGLSQVTSGGWTPPASGL